MDTIPSSWGAGFALGLCLAAIVGLGALDRGQAVPWARCGVIVVASLGAVPSLEFGLRAAWAIFTAVGGAVLEWRERTRPAVADEPEAPEQKKSDYDPEREAWRIALDRFFRAGDAAGGFSAGRLAGVAGSDAWPRLVHFYASEQGGNVLRDAGTNIGHTWGHGWTLDRVMLALGNDKLPRPDMPLPIITPFVAVTTQRRAPQKGKTAKEPPPRVIEHAQP